MKLSGSTVFLVRENIRITKGGLAEMYEDRARLTKAIADYENAVAELTADLAAFGVPVDEEEKKPRLGLVYLSFATDEAFLGAAILETGSVASAPMLASIMGINPGGECLAHMIPEEAESCYPAEYRGRLLSKADVDEMSAKVVAAGGEDMKFMHLGDIEAAGQ